MIQSPINHTEAVARYEAWKLQQEQIRKENEKNMPVFAAIILKEWEGCKNKFQITMKDGTTKVLRLFENSGRVCEYNKGARCYGHYADITGWVKVEPVVPKEKNKFRQFHNNSEKAARLLRESGFWPEIFKRMEVQAAMTEQDYNELVELYNEYWAIFNIKGLTGDEMDAKQREVRQKFDAYYEGRGAKSDFYHFRQLSDTKQIISVPYTNGGYDKGQQLAWVHNIIEQVKDGDPDRHNGYKWYGGYDYSIEIRKNEDGTIIGWYSAEYKGCGNGHYYLLLDAEHAIYYEDD